MSMHLLFAGCYERFLFGFIAPADSDQGEPSVLERKYTFAAHKHAVKCVAAAGPLLASGGADDTIHLYDLKHDKDLGFLMNPGDGNVPCVKFFVPVGGTAATHLFSGSADGSISIWQAGGGWEHLKTMPGHKGSVNDLAVHQSGRLALSVARDKHMRMWNLLKGNCSYMASLELEAEAVAFVPGGESYVLVCSNLVTVHSTSGEGGVLATLTHARRVQCMAQCSDNVLLTGCEDGAVKVWDLRTSKCSHSLERLHTSRVRGLTVLRPGTAAIPELFATASSDGIVKVWDGRMLSAGLESGGGGSGGSARCVATGETKARITCLCSTQPSPPKQPKGQRQGKKKVEQRQPNGDSGPASTSGAGDVGVPEEAAARRAKRAAARLPSGPAAAKAEEAAAPPRRKAQRQAAAPNLKAKPVIVKAKGSAAPAAVKSKKKGAGAQAAQLRQARDGGSSTQGGKGRRQPSTAGVAKGKR